MPVSSPVSSRRVAWSVFILLMLIFSKYFYLASISSYYSFYLIEKFHLPVQTAQLYLFVFLLAVALGGLIGGPLGDRIGRKRVIWFSILGVAPFTMALPYVGLLWTGILSFLIGLILSSAFSAILVFAQELMPGRIGAVSGLFFGFAFGMGGIGAAVLGSVADRYGIEFVYRFCAYLPLLGMIAAFLPNIERRSVSPSDRLTHHLILLVTQYGLLIVGMNVLLDQIGLPVPAMPTLIVAGAVAADGTLASRPLFAWSVAACVAGRQRMVPGRSERYGIRVLKTLCRISLEPDSCVSQTQTRFERWGINSLVIAKFVPGLAIIAPPLAGALRIGWLRFIALSACGAILWVGAGSRPGMLFKSQIDADAASTWIASAASPGLIAARLLAIYIAFKWWERSASTGCCAWRGSASQDLYELMQAGASPIIIDVRSATARALEPRWIPGALHVPLQEVAGTSRSCRAIARSSCIAPVRARLPRRGSRNS